MEPVEKTVANYRIDTRRKFAHGRAWLQVVLTTFFDGECRDLSIQKIEATVLTEKDQIGETLLPHGLMRDFPYNEILSKAALQIQEIHPPEDGSNEASNFHQLRNEWPNGDLEAVSKAVAGEYHLATLTGQPAQQAVAEAFNVSRSTAGRMIAKARELGKIQVKGVVGRPRKGSDHGKEIPRSGGDR